MTIAETLPATIATLLITTAIPRIGTFWAEQGGVYAGIVAGEKGAPDYHLIHATSEHEIFDANWQASIEAAQAPINGHSDWSLPDRREARLLAINCRDSFDLDGWYWTASQFAHLTDYAWVQGFDYGNQYGNHESNEYRARAVRRLLIIQ
ncbi:DUF1566 domain-containing protein [Undibacterium sp. SXout20W]|uniref:Lcl C-terminal domain-containing protein n=1 Tax=Undibacterium sp. SXout20W TaxID=3413051 RepID=UPI003BF065D8